MFQRQLSHLPLLQVHKKCVLLELMRCVLKEMERTGCKSVLGGRTRGLTLVLWCSPRRCGRNGSGEMAVYRLTREREREREIRFIDEAIKRMRPPPTTVLTVDSTIDEST